MNLFYEKYPSTIRVHEKWIPIITDFREYIRLFDMLRCDELKSREKVFIIQEYFLEDITIDADAIMALSDFILMLDPADEQYSEEIETPRKKNLFFLYDRLSIYLIRFFTGLWDRSLKQSNIFTGGSFAHCLMDCLMIRKSNSGSCIVESTCLGQRQRGEEKDCPDTESDPASGGAVIRL